MTWVIIGVFGILLAVFIYKGFRTRCPNCGQWGFNTHTKENNEYEERHKEEYPEINAFEKQLSDMMKSNPETRQFAKDPDNRFANKLLTCKNCKHEFDRQTAMIWQKTAKKLGEQKTIEEYRKLQNEN